MKCRDFQREWDALLDGEATAAPSTEDVEARLLTHAGDCPDCRQIQARYQALRQAIRVWRNPPVPPADLVHRVLSVPDEIATGLGRSEASRARMVWSAHRERVRWISGLAATIFLCLVGGTILNRLDRQKRPANVAPIGVRDPHSVAAPKPTLDRALAEATSATWDLARSASGPAARVGRELLAATGSTGDPSFIPTSLDPIGAGSVEAVEMLQQVGDHLSAGVEPLSSTARHAFGFLLGPPLSRAGSRPGGPNSRGARSG